MSYLRKLEPIYHTKYDLGRLASRIIGWFGLATVIFGVYIIGIEPAFGSGASAFAIATGIGTMISGVTAIGLSFVMNAIFDTADNSRRLVQVFHLIQKKSNP